MRLGFDFDNTLISYDTLFRQVALDQGLIPADTPPQKNAVRDYLRKIGQEDAWTRLQGEVYGGRIREAEPYEGMQETLRQLGGKEIPMVIVSHKTRWPFLGERYDLHEAARGWLEQQGFHSADGLGWLPGQVFFELTKEDKAARIAALGCTHYVDDLPEILDMLPPSIEKILFAPAGAAVTSPEWKVMTSWHQLPALLKLA